MIKDTQRHAWEWLQEKLPKKRAAVFGAILSSDYRGGATIYEIAEDLKWPINCISGRVTELADAGLIHDSQQRRNNRYSGKPCIVWARSGGPPTQTELKF
jgi:predicted transcriptional regulator